MTRVIRRETTHIVSPAGNADQVISHCAIPQDGKLNNIWLDVQIVGPAAGISPIVAIPIGVRGYLLRVPDPDNPDSVQDTWDRMVVKDVAISVVAGSEDVNIDETSADTSNVWEIGLINPAMLIDADQMSIEVFKRQEVLTAARARMAAVSGTSLWIPTLEFRAQVSRTYRMHHHYIAVFAVTAPAGDQTTATVDQTPSLREWNMLRYVELALESAFVDLMGMSESGAEDPFAIMASFIADFIEPLPFEETAGAFGVTAFNVFSHFTYDLSVPGNMDSITLASE